MKEIADQFYVVPKVILEKILDGNEKILSKLNADESPNGKTLPGGYITEAQAKAMLKRGTTWFWNMRKAGFLNSAKMGGKNHYSIKEIEKLLDSAFTGNRK